MQSEPMDITFAKCIFTIGQSMSCGHVTATLYQLANYKLLKESAIPTDVVKTSMKQTWHEPRGQQIRGSEIGQIEFRGYNRLNPRKETASIKSTLCNPVRSEMPSAAYVKEKCAETDSELLLLSVVPDIPLDSVTTKFGKMLKGSVLSYQQKQHSDYILNIYDAEAFPTLPCRDVMVHNYSRTLTQEQSARLGSLSVTAEGAGEIEEHTRMQSSDPRWHNVRRDRVTASKVGEIITRKKDFEKLAERWRTVVTAAMKHGVASESTAAQAYSERLENAVNIYPCGIIVCPTAPWLAASPDRRVYQPNRNPAFGLLEIKCPVSSVLEIDYLKRDEDGNFRLKKNHNYYRQVMMQLACTGLEWCDFFVWTENDCHLETIHFDDGEWQSMKDKIDMFFFEYFV